MPNSWANSFTDNHVRFTHAPSVMLSNGADLTVENEIRKPSSLGQLAAPYGSFGRSSGVKRKVM